MKKIDVDNPELTSSGIEELPSGGTMITGDGIGTYRNLMMYNGLVLECKTGMKMSRVISAHQAAKRDYGLKGNKLTVLKALGKKFVEYGYITQDQVDKDLAEIAKAKELKSGR